MRVGLAQVASDACDVAGNVAHHLRALAAVPPGAADLVVFPELSLTGYDPAAAVAAALSPDDPRLAPFQAHADATGTAVAVGLPLRVDGSARIRIALLVARRGAPPAVVGKHHLHADETPWAGRAAPGPAVLPLASRVGLAICYEVSVAAHADALAAAGAAVYVASAAKTPSGVAEARRHLAATARRHGLPALLANCVGTCEGVPAGGGSFALAPDGRLVAALGPDEEAVLVADTDAGTATAHPVARRR